MASANATITVRVRGWPVAIAALVCYLAGPTLFAAGSVVLIVKELR